MKIDKNIDANNASWTFKGIEKDFEKHIRKSVPFYDHSHDVCSYSDFSYRKKTVLDTNWLFIGTLINKLLEWNKNKSLKLVGIDSEAGMINYCKNKIMTKE